MTQRIDKHLAALEQMRPKLTTLFPHYITHIRFPRFKNISSDTRIDFTFPITVLVGPNGAGKTSVLNALWGAPHGYSTGDYWFSTEVDPIVEGQGSPNRFIYGHFNPAVRKVVETRKARVRKVRDERPDPNYWEPTKETTGDGMDVPVLKKGSKIRGRSGDRWNPVRRKVLYINFRRELSAFDKYFYFARDPGLKRLSKKKDLISRDAKVLKHVINSNDTSVKFAGKTVATENRLLSEPELAAISTVLGHEYAQARLVRHRLFRGADGLSLLFKTNHVQYSEAFAGSGEIAATSCIIQILEAPEGTLVLLDEPEVSLHPGAQERLLEFLMEACKQKKLQIIISTHAPSMVGALPDDAIKVFFRTAAGTSSVIPRSSPYSAFRWLGAREGGAVRIVTEDRLASEVIKLALLNLDQATRERFQVDYVPGGAEAILTYRIPVFMDGKDDVFVFLDGDKQKNDRLVDPDTIPVADDGTLGGTIRAQFGVTPQLTPDGHDGEANKQQLIKLQRRYLKYALKHVRYLPGLCPEEMILRAIGTSPIHPPTAARAKQLLRRIAQDALGEAISAEDVDLHGKSLLAQKRHESAELQHLSQQLRDIEVGVRPR